MNAQVDATGGTAGEENTDAMLKMLHEAVAALEAGNRAKFASCLNAVVDHRENDLAAGVARIARRVHEAIHKLDLDSRLACMAGREIPDARSHLDYVVRMTDEAAHRTLDLVENSRDLLDAMVSQQSELMQKIVAGTVDREQAKGEFIDSLGEFTGAVRGNLSALAQAQEYQDLSGQLIRRVIALVRNVEVALVELLRISGSEINLPAADESYATNQELLGPAAKSASTQQDADALLADLGF